MNKIKANKRVLEILILIVLAFLFLLIFSNGTSPLVKYYYGMDSAFFMLFGKCMKNGLKPYVDIFDHKGPYFFWLQELGQIISDGKNGAFAIQLVNLNISMIIADNIYKYVKKDISFHKRLLLQLPILWILSVTFREGNLTEEFSLPFLFASLLFFLKYLKSYDNNNYNHNPIIAMLYGLFIGIIALSRITNAAFICSIVLTIVILLIYKKEYKNLIINALAFIVGLIISFIPVYLYYSSINGLENMLNSVFVFAFKYSLNASFKYRFFNYLKIEKIVFIIPTLLPLAVLILKKESKSKEFLFSIISFVATFIATFLGESYTHYFVLTIPNILFGICLIIKNKDDVLIFKKNKVLIVLSILIIIGQGFYVIEALGKNVLQMFDYSLSKKESNYYQKQYLLDKEIGDYIPNEDKNSVWGYGIKARFYLRTDTYPCVKYFDYLDQFLGYDKLSDNIINDFNENKPKWIVISKEKEELPDFISNKLETNYYLFAENEDYYLYNIY